MALTRKEHSRDNGAVTWHTYMLDGQPAVGVTTATRSIGGSDGLVNWAAGTVAAYAYDNRERLADLSRDEYMALVRDASRRVRDEAKNAGVAVHAIAHALLTGAPVQVPDYLTGHVDAVLDFMERHDVQDVAAERPCASRRWRYAGTFDLVARLADGNTWLLDYKTGASIWLSTACQLAAYRFADFYVDEDGNERAMPTIDRVGVVKVTPDGWELLPVKAEHAEWTTFLHALHVHRFAKTPVANVIGPALDVPPITNAHLPVKEDA